MAQWEKNVKKLARLKRREEYFRKGQLHMENHSTTLALGTKQKTLLEKSWWGEIIKDLESI